MQLLLISGKRPFDAARKKCRKKFLHYFPRGFSDPTYKAWERDYKLNAHKLFEKQLNKDAFKSLLDKNKYSEIASIAINVEARTNLLFSFEKMALRDAVKPPSGAKKFSEGLFEFLHGDHDTETKFTNYIDVIGNLPRKQTRVLTWPVLTVFGFIANPREHIFVKPMVTKRAAESYMFELSYSSRPDWKTYSSVLEFAKQVKADTSDLKPRDYIDLQSFIWVMGSDEYPL